MKEICAAISEYLNKRSTDEKHKSYPDLHFKNKRVLKIFSGVFSTARQIFSSLAPYHGALYE